MVIILSCNSASAVYYALKHRNDCLNFEIKSLNLSDKSQLVRMDLAQHGKKLDETAFNNQVHCDTVILYYSCITVIESLLIGEFVYC